MGLGKPWSIEEQKHRGLMHTSQCGGHRGLCTSLGSWHRQSTVSHQLMLWQPHWGTLSSLGSRACTDSKHLFQQ
jgi:hypothetical protein